MNCPQCGLSLQVPEEAIGKKGKCRKCGHVFQASRQGSTDDSPSFRVNVELHFLEMEQCHIHIENFSITEQHAKVGEILFLANYLLRVMSNFGGPENPTAQSIALVLQKFCRSSGEEFEEFCLDQKMPAVLSYDGSRGRKIMIGQLACLDDQRRDFSLEHKGFSADDTTIGYYGPVSVMCLLRFLYSRRGDDANYGLVIGAVMEECARHFFEDTIELGTQHRLADKVALDCITAMSKMGCGLDRKTPLI